MAECVLPQASRGSGALLSNEKTPDHRPFVPTTQNLIVGLYCVVDPNFLMSSFRFSGHRSTLLEEPWS